MKRFVLVGLVVLMFSSNAMAAQWLLDATWKSNPAINFSVEFNDEDNDNIFTLSEMGEFIGINGISTKVVGIDHLPDNRQISTPAGSFITLSDASNSNPDNWHFLLSGGTGGSMPWSNFNYMLTQTGATPIPGAIWLLGSGLIGLVGLQRRKKAA